MVLPLILSIEAADTDKLTGHTAVSPHIVIQPVLIIFQAEGEVRWHEYASVELADVLRPCHPRQICGCPIGIGIHPRPIVAGPGNMLGRSKGRQPVAVVRREPVETQAAGVYAMLHLLGDHRLVWRKIQVVTTSTEFVQMVIFSSQLAVHSGFQIGTHAESLRLESRQLRETVPVAVEAVLLADLAEDCHSHLVVLADKGRIEGSVVVQGRSAPDAAQIVGHGRRIARRLPGDDVDRAGNGGRAEKSRTSTPADLDPIHHIRRNLLNAIDACQGAEYRPRIDKYLGIRPIQPIDPHLLVAAVLAVVLHTDSRLEHQTLRKRSCIDPLVGLHIHYIHKSRSQHPRYLAAARRDHHAVDLHIVFLKLEIHFQCVALLDDDLMADCFPANSRSLQGECALRKMLEVIVPTERA